MNKPKSIAIDEEGYFILQGGIRLNEESTGHDILKGIQKYNFGVLTSNYNNDTFLIEPFDKPLVAKQIHIEDGQIIAQMPYQYRCPLQPDSFCADTWDRFHALTDNGVPVVMSRVAQAELFNLASDFTDESLVLNGKTVATPDYYQSSDAVNNEPFWTEKYQEQPSPPWNLGFVHPEFKNLSSMLKLNKMRILVPGCGFAHDAAYLAEQGHKVTAIDLSQEAIDQAKTMYGHIENLTLIAGDVFSESHDFTNSFDIVVEHTFYCAVTPSWRDKIIQHWKSWLVDRGHIMGVFFVVPKRTGPYFGGSEWELREKLKKDFDFLHWNRSKLSPEWRFGAELVMYAQKKEKSF